MHGLVVWQDFALSAFAGLFQLRSMEESHLVNKWGTVKCNSYFLMETKVVRKLCLP